MNHAGINIGYGFTKLQTPRTSFRIPSVVAPSQESFVPDSLFAKRDTERVMVQGKPYEIGMEAVLIDYNPAGHKIAIPRWCDTYQYRALMQLCLDKLALEPNAEQDWCVVIGVAVNQTRDPAYIQKLKNLWIAEHTTSAGRKINIVECLVAPEPVGAFWSIVLTRPEINTIAERTTLVVLDGGYFTFDWTVIRKKKLVWDASNAVNTGMHKIYLDLQQRIKTQYHALVDLVEIELAVSSQGTIYLSGQEIDLTTLLQDSLQQHIPNVLSAMSTACSNFVESQSVFILAGGSAELLLPFLRDLYPDHQIIVPNDPQMANADGYLRIAQAATRAPASENSED